MPPSSSSASCAASRRRKAAGWAAARLRRFAGQPLDLVDLRRHQRRQLGAFGGARLDQRVEGQRPGFPGWRHRARRAPTRSSAPPSSCHDHALERQQAIDPRRRQAGFGRHFARDAHGAGQRGGIDRQAARGCPAARRSAKSGRRRAGSVRPPACAPAAPARQSPAACAGAGPGCGH